MRNCTRIIQISYCQAYSSESRFSLDCNGLAQYELTFAIRATCLRVAGVTAGETPGDQPTEDRPARKPGAPVTAAAIAHGGVGSPPE